jgi:hypothetical protein
MKKCTFLLILIAMFLFVSGTAWAASQADVPKDTPAILASLDKTGLIALDDKAIADIRGEADPYTQYVLVKILGINTFDGGAGVQWTWNPLGYRYGYWGGPGWTNGGSTSGTASTADDMDKLFRFHDQVYAASTSTAADKLAADGALLYGLVTLPKTPIPYWGNIYVSTPDGLTTPNVSVSGVSLIGGKLFLGWRNMPYTEYSRREAMAGMGLLIFGKSVAIKLQ